MDFSRIFVSHFEIKKNGFPMGFIHLANISLEYLTFSFPMVPNYKERSYVQFA